MYLISSSLSRSLSLFQKIATFIKFKMSVYVYIRSFEIKLKTKAHFFRCASRFFSLKQNKKTHAITI